MRKKKRRKFQKKMAVEGGSESLDEASVTLTAAEEIPFSTSISSRDKIRSLSLFLFSVNSLFSPGHMTSGRCLATS